MVSFRRKALAAAAIAFLVGSTGSATHAQSLRTYTTNPAGASSLSLGYEPPRPIASLAAVDGFRDYASLHARHQALDLASPDVTGRIVGNTQGYARPIWAYAISDAGTDTVDGEREGVAFINGNIHAREWQAPEVSTGILEYLAERANDGGMVRYVLDNFEVVLIPVFNVDGLLQTQRYPTEVIVGQDPTAANWPRDGRMRRKNMRGVDEVLTTFDDHLFGIDLNRNHEPYWGPNSSGNSRGVANVRALTHHGATPRSEAESQAIMQVLSDVGTQNLRLGVDLHSFGAVFFAGNAQVPSLMTHQQQLVGRINAAQAAVARSTKFPNGRNYAYAPDPPNAGIGSVSEMLATYRIPAWTLEIEPAGGGTDYGGTGGEHDGFILPAAEIRRVRDGWATAHALAFYHQAGPPYLAQSEVRDASTGEVVYRAERVRAANGTRPWVVTRDVALLEGRAYRGVVRFSKPMRVRTNDQVAQFPGQQVALEPTIAIGDGAGTLIRASERGWLGEDRKRYRDDSYGFTFDVGANVAGSTRTVRVDAADLAQLGLDGDAGTPVRFDAGFTNYEAPGSDSSTKLRFATSAAPISASLSHDVAREGDSVIVTLTRRAPGPAVSVRAEALHVDTSAADVGAWSDSVTWAAGETGVRRLRLPTVADGTTEGSESLWIRIVPTSGTADLIDAALPLKIEERIRFTADASSG